MKCPFCACPESKVVDSRPTDDEEKIRRRRECIKCGKCEETCPQHLHIRDLLEDVAKRFE